eukprot:PhM_4_TR5785/c1_g1_i1/m.79639
MTTTATTNQYIHQHHQHQHRTSMPNLNVPSPHKNDEDNGDNNHHQNNKMDEEEHLNNINNNNHNNNGRMPSSSTAAASAAPAPETTTASTSSPLTSSVLATRAPNGTGPGGHAPLVEVAIQFCVVSAQIRCPSEDTTPNFTRYGVRVQHHGCTVEDPTFELPEISRQEDGTDVFETQWGVTTTRPPIYVHTLMDPSTGQLATPQLFGVYLLCRTERLSPSQVAQKTINITKFSNGTRQGRMEFAPNIIVSIRVSMAQSEATTTSATSTPLMNNNNNHNNIKTKRM